MKRESRVPKKLWCVFERFPGSSWMARSVHTTLDDAVHYCRRYDTSVWEYTVRPCSVGR